MPFAHVRPLPVPPPFAAAVEERHVTVTWQAMLRAVVAPVSREARVAGENVFVDFENVFVDLLSSASGRVLDGGDVVRW